MADQLQALFGSDSETDSETASPQHDLRVASREAEETPGSSPDQAADLPRVAKEESESEEETASHHSDHDPDKKSFHLLADEAESSADDEAHEVDDVKPGPPRVAEDEDEAETTEQPAVESAIEVPEAEAEDDEETRIEVDIARLEPDLGGRFVYWKMQDFLRVESKPFDMEGYDDEFEDYEEDPPLDVQEAIRQKVKATMRWKFTTMPDGSKGPPESNVKFVKWSDGSASIVVGNEYFDASFVPLKGEHHQLFIRQGTGLQGGTVFKEKMNLRPAVNNPLARKSRLAARPSVGSRPGVKEEGSQAARPVVFLSQVADKDPEKMRAELMRKEDERLKASIRRETQQRRVRERVRISRDYLEGNDEEDDNSVSLLAIKNQFKRGDFTRPVYSDDESDGESRRKKLEDAKDMDDDDDFGMKKKKTEEGAAKKRVAVIEDDDED